VPLAVKLGVTVALHLESVKVSQENALKFPAINSTTINWEVLIVNNNCTDDADEIVDQFTNRLPIRLEREKRQRLSNARNCAIATAKGDYILWTDDDVIVDPNWLAKTRLTVRRSEWPDTACCRTSCGGGVELLEQPDRGWPWRC